MDTADARRDVKRSLPRRPTKGRPSGLSTSEAQLCIGRSCAPSTNCGDEDDSIGVPASRPRIADQVDADPWETLGPRPSPIDATKPETVEFLRLPWLPGVEIMTVTDSNRCMRSYHTTFTVCTVLDAVGGNEWTYRGMSHQSAKGSLMLMEPGEMHVTNRIIGIARKFWVLLVDPEPMRGVAADIGLRRPDPHLTQATTDRPDLFSAFAAFHASVEAMTTPLLEQQSRLVECLQTLLEVCGEERVTERVGLNRPAVARARDYIHHAYREDIPLEALAAVAGVSPCHLNRIFSRELGLAPHAYQIQLRLARARRLLSQGLPPVEVAPATGFYDQSHFGAFFKRHIGVTPRRYAAATRRI